MSVLCMENYAYPVSCPLRLNDIDLLGSVGLKIDLGQCIMILTIKKHDRESAVM